jgi:hypothetical protein
VAKGIFDRINRMDRINRILNSEVLTIRWHRHSCLCGFLRVSPHRQDFLCHLEMTIQVSFVVLNPVDPVHPVNPV